jgi:choline dehydrogenase
VSLAGKDPDLAPIIDPRYYSDESDLSAMVEYLAMAREVGNTPALQPWGGIEVLPGPSVTTASAVHRYIRAASGTSFHPVGTCQMGTDGSAVVDPQLKVHGIEGLRVADASVMPDIVNVNPNATVVAIAEKAIDLIFS